MKDTDVRPMGNHLDDKNIALLVTGGIAAYKTPSLARHFRQYGANVQVIATPESLEYFGRTAIEWASQNPLLTDNNFRSEHLRGYDAYVVAPATYNTINKFANGTADNLVTTMLASGLGRTEMGLTKILISPTMHDSMRNSIYGESTQKLMDKGVYIIEPRADYGKANIPDTHTIVAKTIRKLSKSPLNGRNVLITAGPTPGRIDNVRYLTNRFRGRLGIAIAEEAYLRGADEELILGASGLTAPDFINTNIIRDYDQYAYEVMRALDLAADIGIFSAAVADYIPETVLPGKTPSRGALTSIPLIETDKIIEKVKKKFPKMFMATFKYEEGLSIEELVEIADRRAKGYDLVVANRGEDMSEERHESIIVDETGILSKPSTKLETARSLLDIIEDKVR